VLQTTGEATATSAESVLARGRAPRPFEPDFQARLGLAPFAQNKVALPEIRKGGGDAGGFPSSTAICTKR